MKTKILFALLFTFAFLSIAKAQDTIDTNYYRYDNHFLRSGFQGAMNLETGEFIDGCPNGVGFTSMERRSFFEYSLIQNGYFGTTSSGRFCPYMYYKLSATKTKVYGIAMALDTIVNLTEGDSLTVTLCDAVGNYFVPLDSITIKGGEIGKRRLIEIPILRNDLDFSQWEGFEPYDNCIDTILYRQVLEFYFDGFKEVSGAQLWWRARLVTSNGSEFKTTVCLGANMCYVAYFDEHCVGGNMYATWDFFFPIITPLPEWESSKLEQLIPDAHELPDDPDPAHNPDPDPEAINGVYGNLPISIYPNPTNGVTTISSPEAIKELTVTDLAGRVLLHHSSLGTSTTLDTTPLEPGLYLLKVTTASGTATTKLAVR